MADPKSFNEQVIEEFRANEGKVGGRFEGATLLLLTTTGAKSGQQRTSPLGFDWEDDAMILWASNAGGDTHPSWYYNIRANPTVTIELGTEQFQAEAAEITGETYDDLMARYLKTKPFLRDYQANTSRPIPLVSLRRMA